MERYLNQVKKIWSHITVGDENLRLNLDMTTVQLLEGRCPSDPTDRAFIKAHRLDIFPAILNANQRRAISARIMSVKTIIPSIFTFLEDTKYLEICAKILKTLIPKPLKGTLHQNLQRLHNGQKTFFIQMTEGYNEEINEISAESVHWKVYRQLWLYAMRHFPEMTGHPPRTENAKSKMKLPGSEYSWWYGIAELAKRCGYQGLQVPYSSEADADEQMTRDFLLRVRPSSLYTFNNSNLDQTLGQIMAILGEDYLVRSTNVNDEELIPCDADINHRCGVPFWSSFYADRSNLFLARVYSNHSSDHVATTFFVKSTMFKNFFGYTNPNRNEVPDLENGPSTSLILSDPSQNSQPPEAAGASRTGEEMSTSGTSPMPIDGTSAMSIDYTSAMPIGGASPIPTVTAQSDPGQGRLDKWLQPKSTPSNSTSTVTQRLCKEKQAKIAQTRFMRALRPRPKENPTLKMEQLDTGVSKQQAINMYMEIQNKKDGSTLYLIKEDCANEHFSIYRCAPEDTEDVFGHLESGYVYPVPIRQEDRSGFSKAGSAITKRKKISSLHNIANNKPYCVLATKLSTQVSFEEDKSERIQSSEQQQQLITDEEEL